MSSRLNKLFVTLLISVLVVGVAGIASAKIVQSDMKKDLKESATPSKLSESDEKISSNLGLKIYPS